MNPKIARYDAERKLMLLSIIFALCSTAFAVDTIAVQEGMKSLTYKKVGPPIKTWPIFWSAWDI